MQSSQVRHVEKQIFQVAPLPNDDGPKNAPLWLLQDPLVLVKDWFSLDENQLIRCIKEYVSKLTGWRNCKNVNFANTLKKLLKRIMINLQININYLDQKLLYSEVEEEIIELTSLYLDLELRFWSHELEKKRAKDKAMGSSSNNGVVEQRMVDHVLYWLYTMLPNTSNRVDALLSLIMVYKQQSKTLLDPVFRKVMLELEPGPLRDTTYVRQLLFYKLWNEKILVCDDEFAIQLRKRVLSTLTPLNPYAMFHAKLRSCLPYVHKDVHNVTEFLLKANISFKHSCIQFLNSRRSQFENIHLNVDTINVDSIAINDSPLDFLYGERDEMSGLLDMMDSIKNKPSTNVQNQNIYSISLTDEASTTSDFDIIDLTEDEEPQLVDNDQPLIDDDCLSTSPSTSQMSTTSDDSPVKFPQDDYPPHQNSLPIMCAYSLVPSLLTNHYMHMHYIPEQRWHEELKENQKTRRKTDCCPDKTYMRRQAEKQKNKDVSKKDSNARGNFDLQDELVYENEDNVPDEAYEMKNQDSICSEDSCDRPSSKLSIISIDDNSSELHQETSTQNFTPNNQEKRLLNCSAKCAVERTCNDSANVNLSEKNLVLFSESLNRKSSENQGSKIRAIPIEELKDSTRIRFEESSLSYSSLTYKSPTTLDTLNLTQKKINIVTPSQRSPIKNLTKNINHTVERKSIEPVLDERLQTETSGSNGFKLHPTYKRQTSNNILNPNKNKSANLNSESINNVLDNRLNSLVSKVTNADIFIDSILKKTSEVLNSDLREKDNVEDLPAEPITTEFRKELRPDLQNLNKTKPDIVSQKNKSLTYHEMLNAENVNNNLRHTDPHQLDNDLLINATQIESTLPHGKDSELTESLLSEKQFDKSAQERNNSIITQNISTTNEQEVSNNEKVEDTSRKVYTDFSQTTQCRVPEDLLNNVTKNICKNSENSNLENVGKLTNVQDNKNICDSQEKAHSDVKMSNSEIMTSDRSFNSTDSSSRELNVLCEEVENQIEHVLYEAIEKNNDHVLREAVDTNEDHVLTEAVEKNNDHVLCEAVETNEDHVLTEAVKKNYVHVLCQPVETNEDHVLCEAVEKNYDHVLCEAVETIEDHVLCEAVETNEDQVLCDAVKKNNNHVLCEAVETIENHLLCEAVETNEDNVLCEAVKTNEDHLLCEAVETNEDNVLCEAVKTNEDHVLCDAVETNEDHVLCDAVETNKDHVLCESVETDNNNVPFVAVEKNQANVECETSNFKTLDATDVTKSEEIMNDKNVEDNFTENVEISTVERPSTPIENITTNLVQESQIEHTNNIEIGTEELHRKSEENVCEEHLIKGSTLKHSENISEYNEKTLENSKTERSLIQSNNNLENVLNSKQKGVTNEEQDKFESLLTTENFAVKDVATKDDQNLCQLNNSAHSTNECLKLPNFVKIDTEKTSEINETSIEDITNKQIENSDYDKDFLSNRQENSNTYSEKKLNDTSNQSYEEIIEEVEAVLQQEKVSDIATVKKILDIEKNKRLVVQCEKMDFKKFFSQRQILRSQTNKDCLFTQTRKSQKHDSSERKIEDIYPKISQKEIKSDMFETRSVLPSKEKIESVIVSKGTINFLIATDVDKEDDNDATVKRQLKKTTLPELYQCVIAPERRKKSKIFKTKKRVPDKRVKRTLKNCSLNKSFKLNQRITRSNKEEDKSKSLLDIDNNLKSVYNDETHNWELDHEKPIEVPSYSHHITDVKATNNLPEVEENTIENVVFDAKITEKIGDNLTKNESFEIEKNVQKQLKTYNTDKNSTFSSSDSQDLKGTSILISKNINIESDRLGKDANSGLKEKKDYLGNPETSSSNLRLTKIQLNDETTEGVFKTKPKDTVKHTKIRKRSKPENKHFLQQTPVSLSATDLCKVPIAVSTISEDKVTDETLNIESTFDDRETKRCLTISNNNLENVEKSRQKDMLKIDITNDHQVKLDSILPPENVGEKTVGTSDEALPHSATNKSLQLPYEEISLKQSLLDSKVVPYSSENILATSCIEVSKTATQVDLKNEDNFESVDIDVETVDSIIEKQNISDISLDNITDNESNERTITSEFVDNSSAVSHSVSPHIINDTECKDIQCNANSYLVTIKQDTIIEEKHPSVACEKLDNNPLIGQKCVNISESMSFRPRTETDSANMMGKYSHANETVLVERVPENPTFGEIKTFDYINFEQTSIIPDDATEILKSKATVEFVTCTGLQNFITVSEETFEELTVHYPQEIISGTQVKTSVVEHFSRVVQCAPPMLDESCSITQFCEIAYAHERIVKCSVNGQHKSTQVYVSAASQIIKSDYVTTGDLVIDPPNSGKAVECINLLTSSVTEHLVFSTPEMKSIALFRSDKALSYEDYNMYMFASTCCALDPLPVVKSPKKEKQKGSILEDKIQHLKNKKGIQNDGADILTSSTDTIAKENIQNNAAEPEFTIPNTTHLQLCPEDYDFGFTPIVPTKHSYSLETGIVRDFCTDLAGVKPKQPTYGAKPAKAKNDFTDIFNLANIEREVVVEQVITPPQKDNSPKTTLKVETKEVNKDKVRSFLNKCKKNESAGKPKSSESDTNKTSPYGYIRSTRPLRMVTRKRRNSTIDCAAGSSKKPNHEAEFDRLLSEHKKTIKTTQEKDKFNKSFDSSFDSTVSDDLPLIFHVKKSEEPKLNIGETAIKSSTDKTQNTVNTESINTPNVNKEDLPKTTENESSEETITKILRSESVELKSSEDNKLKEEKINNCVKSEILETDKSESQLEQMKKTKELEKPCEKMEKILTVKKDSKTVTNVKDSLLSLGDIILDEEDVSLQERINKRTSANLKTVKLARADIELTPSQIFVSEKEDSTIEPDHKLKEVKIPLKPERSSKRIKKDEVENTKVSVIENNLKVEDSNAQNSIPNKIETILIDITPKDKLDIKPEEEQTNIKEEIFKIDEISEETNTKIAVQEEKATKLKIPDKLCNKVSADKEMIENKTDGNAEICENKKCELTMPILTKFDHEDTKVENKLKTISSNKHTDAVIKVKKSCKKRSVTNLELTNSSKEVKNIITAERKKIIEPIVPGEESTELTNEKNTMINPANEKKLGKIVNENIIKMKISQSPMSERTYKRTTRSRRKDSEVQSESDVHSNDRWVSEFGNADVRNSNGRNSVVEKWFESVENQPQLHNTPSYEMTTSYHNVEDCNSFEEVSNSSDLSLNIRQPKNCIKMEEKYTENPTPDSGIVFDEDSVQKDKLVDSNTDQENFADDTLGIDPQNINVADSTECVHPMKLKVSIRLDKLTEILPLLKRRKHIVVKESIEDKMDTYPKMKIRKSSSESPKDHKSKKRRYSSAAESSECNADWSNEEVVSPASTSQFEFDSTPDHSGIPSKATKKDYSESILSLTDSPVPSTSCCISSPYPSENSRPDAEHSLSIVCEEEGIDLCKDYNLKYYESLDKFHQQQQQSLQANYCLLDYQFTVTYEHTGDEDLFSNMMSKNMVTVNMNEVQPEVKPHMEEEKRCEFEDFDADNNISGVVDGICRNLDSEINTVIEQIDQDGIDFDNSVEIITDSLLHDEIPLEDAVEIEIIQPVYTTGPSKTITTLADDTRSPVINEIVNDKVVVQKINVENVQVFQDDFLNSYDIVNEHKYEQKVPYITDLEKTPEKKRTKKSASPKVQEVPKKQITPEKTVNDSKSEINTHKKSGLNDKIKTAVNPKENKKPEKKKEEILPPSKFYKSSKSLDGKKIQKSTSSAEELFDLVKNSTIDNIKEPTHSIYIPRQAFNHASRKIQAEFKSQSRKRKPTDELIKPVIKQFKRGEKPVSTSDSSINQKDYKLFSVELDTSRITQANVFRSGSRRTSFSARVPNKENSSMQKKQPKKSNGDEKKSIGVAKKKDTWLDNPVIKANLARFEQVKKM